MSSRGAQLGLIRCPNVLIGWRIPENHLLVGAFGGLLVSLFIAFSGQFPWGATTAAISLFTLVWALGLLAFLVHSVFRWIKPLSRQDILIGTISSFLVGVSIARSVSLYLAQLISSNSQITWNIDYRYHLMHTQSLLHSKGTDNLLIAWGVPTDYHIGPAWVAASLRETLGIPIALSSFAIIPMISHLSILIGLGLLLRYLRVPRWTLIFTLAAASVIPHVHHGYMRVWSRIQDNWPLDQIFIRDQEAWYFGPNLMLNSYLALGSIGAITILLLIRARLWLALAAGSGVAGIYSIKPQYALAMLLLMTIVFTVEGFARKRDSKRFTHFAIALSAGIFSASVFAIFRGSPFSGSNLNVSFVENHEVGLAALQELFGIPGIIISSTILFGLTRLLRGVFRRKAWSSSRLGLLLFSLSATILLGYLFMTAVTVSTVGAAGPERSLNWDLLQGFQFLKLLTLPLAIAWIFQRIQVKLRLITLGFGFLVLAAVPQVIAVGETILKPDLGYEFVDASSVAEVLEEIDVANSLLVISDFADPAQNYWRGRSADYVPAASGAKFWIAGHQSPELRNNTNAQARVAEVRVFFGSVWSPWHETFLEKNSITHVLISSRCEPVWYEALQEIVSPIESVLPAKKWSLIPTDKILSSIPPPNGAGGKSYELQPKFGLAPCLG